MCIPTSRQWAVTKSTVTCLGVSPIVYSSVISSGWPSGVVAPAVAVAVYQPHLVEQGAGALRIVLGPSCGKGRLKVAARRYDRQLARDPLPVIGDVVDLCAVDG